jgi:hypothetical protein
VAPVLKRNITDRHKKIKIVNKKGKNKTEIAEAHEIPY